MVEHLRKRYNVQYIYCWHGAPGSTGVGWAEMVMAVATLSIPGCRGAALATIAASLSPTHPPS